MATKSDHRKYIRKSKINKGVNIARKVLGKDEKISYSTSGSLKKYFIYQFFFEFSF